MDQSTEARVLGSGMRCYLYMSGSKKFLVKETKHHVLNETKESAQLFTGAWSDRIGRKWLFVSGMWI